MTAERQLLNRIAELEKRVARLEAALVKALEGARNAQQAAAAALYVANQ